MNEKMNEKLKEIYDSLTDEQKEKVKNCKTQEELMEFAGEEDFELPEELLEDVAGGWKWFWDEESKGKTKKTSIFGCS